MEGAKAKSSSECSPPGSRSYPFNGKIFRCQVVMAIAPDEAQTEPSRTTLPSREATVIQGSNVPKADALLESATSEVAENYKKLNEQITEARAKEAEYIRNINSLADEIVSQRGKLKEGNDEIDDLRENVAQRERKIGENETAINRLNGEKTELEAQEKSLKSSIEGLKQKIAACTKGQKELEAELGQKNSDLQAISALKAGVDADLKKKSSEAAKLTNENKGLRSELSEKEAEIKSLKADLEEKGAKIMRVNSEVDKLNAQIKTLQAEIAKLKAIITKQKTIITKQEGTITEQKGTITEQKGTITEVSEMNQRALAAIEDEARTVMVEVLEGNELVEELTQNLPPSSNPVEKASILLRWIIALIAAFKKLLGDLNSANARANDEAERADAILEDVRNRLLEKLKRRMNNPSRPRQEIAFQEGIIKWAGEEMAQTDSAEKIDKIFRSARLKQEAENEKREIIAEQRRIEERIRSLSKECTEAMMNYSEVFTSLHRTPPDAECFDKNLMEAAQAYSLILGEITTIAEKAKREITGVASADYNNLSLEEYQRLKSAREDAIQRMHNVVKGKMLPIMRQGALRAMAALDGPGGQMTKLINETDDLEKLREIIKLGQNLLENFWKKFAEHMSYTKVRVDLVCPEGKSYSWKNLRYEERLKGALQLAEKELWEQLLGEAHGQDVSSEALLVQVKKFNERKTEILREIVRKFKWRTTYRRDEAHILFKMDSIDGTVPSGEAHFPPGEKVLGGQGKEVSEAEIGIDSVRKREELAKEYMIKLYSPPPAKRVQPPPPPKDQKRVKPGAPAAKAPTTKPPAPTPNPPQSAAKPPAKSAPPPPAAKPPASSGKPAGSNNSGAKPPPGTSGKV